MQATDLANPCTAWQTFKVGINRDMGHIAITINDSTLFDATDVDPLPEQLHSWVGIGSVGGGWTTGVRYRNMVIETSEKAADSATTALTPPVISIPCTNLARIYELNMSAHTLRKDWWCSERQFVRFEDKTMIMTGPNGTPECILNKPITGDFALNVQMEYLSNEAVNFSVPLYFAQGATLDTTNDPQCRLMFPEGHGMTEINWLVPGAKTENLAQTPYYAPVFGKVYALRLERVGAKLSVFVNGGLLLTAMMPSEDTPENGRVYIGVAQQYSGVKIHGLSVESIARH